MTKEERRALRVKALERMHATQPELLAKKLADLRRVWWDADHAKPRADTQQTED